MRHIFRSPVAAILLASGILAAVVERFAPAAGAVKALREYKGNSLDTRTGSMAWPRSVKDLDGFEVRVARPARSVVSQHWAIDEFVYSVVPPELVTGVSETAWKTQVSNVFAHLQRYRPMIAADPERALRLDPDLVLVSSTARADFTALVRSTGVPIHRMWTTFTTLDQVAEGIRLVGYLTGQDTRADIEYRRFRRALERAKMQRPLAVKRPRVLGLGGRFSYGDGTLFHDIVTTLGAVNVGAEGGLHGYDAVNPEQVLRWNPEWIVAGADAGKTKEQLSRLMSDPAISLTRAARDGRILVFDNRVFLPMSPYSTLMLNALGAALYGR